MSPVATALSAQDYRAAFDTERVKSYPMVDALEAAAGYALDRARLEAAAQVLACPVKKSPPNWQHGRVLYALTLQWLTANESQSCNVLDVGTAKGFSALCLKWALDDGGSDGSVTSVDVIDPHARVSRKTIAEVDGLLTLAETLKPWPEAKDIRFVQSTGIDWLKTHPERIHIAFVDGSHDGMTVLNEGRMLAGKQEEGDLAIFDDVNRTDIRNAITILRHAYHFDVLEVLPTRHYAIGVRR